MWYIEYCKAYIDDKLIVGYVGPFRFKLWARRFRRKHMKDYATLEIVKREVAWRSHGSTETHPQVIKHGL